MQINLPNGLENSLIWWPEKGMGFHPAPAMKYEADYFASYIKRDNTSMAASLTDARISFVSQYTKTYNVIDIGIGGGRFVMDSGCRGYDVNESAVQWLHEKDRFCSPYASPVNSITCWDSLEHIDKPWKLLRQVEQYLFASIPVVSGPDAVLQSKHYKPGEHLWYWTEEGFIRWCDEHGFMFLELSHIERELGREDITTFAFVRR